MGLGFARVDAEYAAVDQHQELTGILFDKIRLMVMVVLAQLVQGSIHVTNFARLVLLASTPSLSTLSQPCALGAMLHNVTP